ncbi:TylF/MycF family methyltransferase [Pelagibacteraceae bacterium]|jgi:hypothetical protein|nr:TylF/MycF family methyltransferase [Pelagibacteraceae bacterium]
MKNNSLNVWKIENSFHFYSDPSRIKKIICHYEILKKTAKVSGHIVECGVFKGNSLIRFLIFREQMGNNKKKCVYGFDVFGKFPKQANIKDNNFAKKHDKEIGLGFQYNKINQILKKKKFKNFKLIKGPVENTLDAFLKKNKSLKISFLHLDLDVYKPTFYALNKLYNRVSRGGIILLDDYGQVEGATRATNDFLKKKGLKNKIKNLKFDKRLKFIEKK